LPCPANIVMNGADAVGHCAVDVAVALLVRVMMNLW